MASLVGTKTSGEAAAGGGADAAAGAEPATARPGTFCSTWTAVTAAAAVSWPFWNQPAS